jgi:hypothetical protein
MWQTWNTSATWWLHRTWVVLAALALCMSACTGPGHSRSAPSAHSPEVGHAGPMLSGDGDGGSGM